MIMIWIQFDWQGAAMPEAEIGVEQLVDELLQYIVLQDSLCTGPNKPWKVIVHPKLLFASITMTSLLIIFPRHAAVSQLYSP